MEGFITLNRKIISHWIFKDDKKFKWWVLMLMEANYSDGKFILGNEVIEVKRGQSCNSLRTWSKMFEATPKTVQQFFKLLQKDAMISTKTVGKGKQSTTLVTIENYNEYQVDGKRERPHKVNAKGSQGKRELPTIEEGNKGNKEKEIYRAFGDLSITFEQVDKLKENFTQEQIDDILDEIQNSKSHTKYIDLYLTANNWLKRNMKKTTEVATYKPTFAR